MDVRVILFLTLFTGLCFAGSTTNTETTEKETSAEKKKETTETETTEKKTSAEKKTKTETSEEKKMPEEKTSAEKKKETTETETTEEKKTPEEKTSAEKKDKKTEEEKTSAEKKDKKTEEEKTSAEKKDMKTEEEKTSAEKKEKKTSEEKTSAEKKDEKTSEEKTSAEKKEKKTSEEKTSAEKKDEKTSEEKKRSAASCPCGLKNLALGGTAVQSSTHETNEAQNAVDGNMNSVMDGGSCSQTEQDMSPWWRVDLQEVCTVTRVSITNRGDCCAERINGAQIRIGNSLDNNGNNNVLAVTVMAIPLGETKTFVFKPIKGRYVNIYIPGRNEILTLSEVEVFGEKQTSMYTWVPRNLALGGTAVQSSTHQTNEAQNAVDGNRNSIMDGGSCSQTKQDMSPWWRVDLEEVCTVTRVSITNRGDCCAERINGAQIRIGNSLANNGNNNELVATVVSIPAGQTKTFEFEAIKGRYVNIYIPGRNEYLTLSEVEVFGEKHTSTYTWAPRNLALGGTAVQSSTEIKGKTDAENSIDGNKNSVVEGGSCSATKEDMGPWWRVDLEEVYAITRVIITNCVDCCAERLEDAQIRIGNSLDNNGNNNKLAATTGTMTHGETKIFEFNPIQGQYVNIYIPGRREFLTLCEVEVYADSVE